MLYADLEGEARLPVRLVIDGADRLDVARIVERPLPLDDSTQVRLAGLAAYSPVETPAGIKRYNQQYKRYIIRYALSFSGKVSPLEKGT